MLSKAWKYHCISHLQNPDLASSCKGFRRRCAATQLQIGFLLTSTGHLAHKRREAADKRVQSVVPDLSSSHREEIAELVTSPFFFPHLLRSFVITASKSITSILKYVTFTVTEEHCLCAGETDKKDLDQAARISTPSTLNLTEHLWATPAPLEDHLNCPLQGSLREQSASEPAALDIATRQC